MQVVEVPHQVVPQVLAADFAQLPAHIRFVPLVLKNLILLLLDLLELLLQVELLTEDLSLEIDEILGGLHMS